MAESYNDQLHRLFHPTDMRPMEIGGPQVKEITFQVTDQCNMACTYCYQHNKGTHRMSLETGKKMVDLLLEPDEDTAKYINSRDCWGVVLSFLGGEPLLEIELISGICDYFLRRVVEQDHPWQTNYMFDICTNGLLYFDPRVQSFLARHRDRVSFTVTIDGNKQIHDSCRVDLAGNGTYDRAIAAVRHWMGKRQREIGSKITIAPGNISLISGAVRDMVAEGYSQINMNCVYEDVWMDHHPGILYYQLKSIVDWLDENGHLDDVELSIFGEFCGKPIPEHEIGNWCGGVGLMLSVDWDGNIYPCQRYSEASITGRTPFAIGHVDTGIMATEEQKQRVHCMSCITRRTQSTDECFHCPVAMGCGWCSAFNYECFGTPDRRATFICGMHKARSLANVYYMAKRGTPIPLWLPIQDALSIIPLPEYRLLESMAAEKGG